MSTRKEWMLGIPGHNELVNLDDVLLLLRGGQLRPTDLVKKIGEPWRAANEMPELVAPFAELEANPKARIEAAASKAAEAKAAEPAKVPASESGARPPLERSPRPSSKPPDSTKSIPKIVATAPAPAPAAPAPAPKAEEKPAPPEDRSPIRTQTSRVPSAAVAAAKAELKAETKAAPKEDKKAETKPPSTISDKTDKISARSVRPRELPKAPPKAAPRIEPMLGKYFSPVDMLRSASFAFEPKKLLYAFPIIPLMLIWSVGMYKCSSLNGAFEVALFVLFNAILFFGLAFLLTGLAFVTRRQIEGRDYYFGEVLNFTVKSAMTAVVYPALAILPSLASLGVLFLLRLARNRSAGLASAMKIGYLLPMIFAFVAVLGALVYQVASMYVPAAAAVEGEGLGGSIRHAWDHVRRQWGRVVLHWLITTVAFGVIALVCLGLSHLAIQLPEIVFGEPDDELIRDAWNNFSGLHSVYRGIAYGLGLLLPISLFGTLGALSYISLRHPAGAQLSPSPLDETSGIAIGAMRGHASPQESTKASDTRPASPEATPAYSDISDDSDEQPLVKE